MYARVTTTPISPYRLDEAIRLAEDSTMPAASKQPGFKGYLMLVDKSSGMAMTITFWQEEGDREFTGQNTDYYKDSISKLIPLLCGTPVVEDFEVAVQV
jgi:hypothetical protein